MILIEKEKYNLLQAEKNKRIRAKNDIHKEAYINDDGIEIPEYFPLYSKEAIVPKKINKNNITEFYVEEDDEIGKEL